MSGSYYQLNQKYNQLLAIINGIPTSYDLQSVLTAGDAAGGLDISNLNNLDVSTINGNVYPPVVAANLQENLLLSTGIPPFTTIQNKAYYLDATGDWVLADPNNSRNKLITIAKGTNSSTDGMYLGSNSTDINLSVAGDIGSLLFLDTVAGEITTTIPPIDNRLVRTMGYKLNASYIKYIQSNNLISPISATGGTITEITVGLIEYRVHTFTTLGLSSFIVNTIGTTNGAVEYLVVAGGGGGGSTGSGGGAGGAGAGGYLESNITVGVGSISVFVGNGGAGATTSINGDDGENSYFSTVIADGGGGGGGSSNTGSNGGSGGGGVSVNSTAGGSGTVGQGNNGGTGGTPSGNYTGGGGGGANAVGGNATSTVAGSGGGGNSSSINGTPTVRGGGGGGGTYSGGTVGSGGLGGGGAGGQGTTGGAAPIAGVGLPTTGGGGGGGGYSISPTNVGSGGTGGSGIVIIRYPIS